MDNNINNVQQLKTQRKHHLNRSFFSRDYGFFPLKRCRIRLTRPKLTQGNNISMNGCLSLQYMSSCDELANCPGCTAPSSVDSWDRLKTVEDEWMNELSVCLIYDG